MVAWHWRQERPPATHIVVQGRGSDVITDVNHLRWDPMDGSSALCDWVLAYGPLKAMVVLAGATPGSGQDLSINRTVAETCLAAAADVGIPRVLVASSSAVYGIGDGMPFSETSHCTPVNDYGLAKIAMEQACDGWRTHNLEVCCLRIGNVAGADALLLNISKSDPDSPVTIDIFSDGRGPVRSYIGPKSLASVLNMLAVHPESLPSILNVAAPKPISMDTLAETIGHPWVPRQAASQSAQNILLDCRLLATFYPFSSAESAPSEMITQWKDALLS